MSVDRFKRAVQKQQQQQSLLSSVKLLNRITLFTTNLRLFHKQFYAIMGRIMPLVKKPASKFHSCPRSFASRQALRIIIPPRALSSIIVQQIRAMPIYGYRARYPLSSVHNRYHALLFNKFARCLYIVRARAISVICT